MKSYNNYNSNYYSSGKANKKSRGNNHNNYNNYNNTNNYSSDSIRIIKRNLVYVINLDPKIADKEILTKKEYFGQYGKITKILVNLNKAYNANNTTSGPSYSAYINYSTNQEAALAILSVDSCILNNKMIKAAFGTTKYCSYYLKKTTCPIKDCVYMHSVSDKNDIISKESADFYVDQHKLAVKISEVNTDKMKELLLKNKSDDVILPDPHSIYSKRNLHSLLKYTNSKDNSKDKRKEEAINNEYNNLKSNDPPKQSLKEYLNASIEKDNKNNQETSKNSKISSVNNNKVTFEKSKDKSNKKSRKNTSIIDDKCSEDNNNKNTQNKTRKKSNMSNNKSKNKETNIDISKNCSNEKLSESIINSNNKENDLSSVNSINTKIQNKEFNKDSKYTTNNNSPIKTNNNMNINCFEEKPNNTNNENNNDKILIIECDRNNKDNNIIDNKNSNEAINNNKKQSISENNTNFINNQEYNATNKKISICNEFKSNCIIENKRIALFNLINDKEKSRFDFNCEDNKILKVNNTNKDNKITGLKFITPIDDKILKSYFIRYTFSSSFNCNEKANIENKFYNSIIYNHNIETNKEAA